MMAATTAANFDTLNVEIQDTVKKQFGLRRGYRKRHWQILHMISHSHWPTRISLPDTDARTKHKNSIHAPRNMQNTWWQIPEYEKKVAVTCCSAHSSWHPHCTPHHVHRNAECVCNITRQAFILVRPRLKSNVTRNLLHKRILEKLLASRPRVSKTD